MERQQVAGRTIAPAFAPSNMPQIEFRVVWAVNPAEKVISFRRFQVFPGARLLLRDGRKIEIGGRAFDLLITLLGSRGSVVTKEDIFRRVWPSMVVVEGNLRWQMGCLREVLGEDRDLIKTVPGRGYLFLAEADEGVGHDA